MPAQETKKPVKLRLYMKGGHSFGMNKEELPIDTRAESYVEWLTSSKIMKLASVGSTGGRASYFGLGTPVDPTSSPRTTTQTQSGGSDPNTQRSKPTQYCPNWKSGRHLSTG